MQRITALVWVPYRTYQYVRFLYIGHCQVRKSLKNGAKDWEILKKKGYNKILIEKIFVWGRKIESDKWGWNVTVWVKINYLHSWQGIWQSPLLCWRFRIRNRHWFNIWITKSIGKTVYLYVMNTVHYVNVIYWFLIQKDVQTEVGQIRC